MIPVCDTATQVIVAARLEMLRGNGHALDGHALLTRLKVAAALALLDEHVEVTDEDWVLAGTVMEVSDHTRGQVVKVLSREAVRGEPWSGRGGSRTDQHHRRTRRGSRDPAGDQARRRAGARTRGLDDACGAAPSA